ncbi:MAG: hypothetical protein M1813_002569 [Trichoglossum hirsutum]|nr:MAG: hypothetical protein M1813_002569 [Trichoglossum hirsutum]
MDVFYYFTSCTAGWLAIQATPLIASPTLIVALLSPDVRNPTPLEDYLARSLGVTLVVLGVLAVLLSGSVPLTSSFSDCPSPLLSSLATN